MISEFYVSEDMNEFVFAIVSSEMTCFRVCVCVCVAVFVVIDLSL